MQDRERGEKVLKEMLVQKEKERESERGSERERERLRLKKVKKSVRMRERKESQVVDIIKNQNKRKTVRGKDKVAKWRRNQ